jgi:hypothetical protein
VTAQTGPPYEVGGPPYDEVTRIAVDYAGPDGFTDNTLSGSTSTEIFVTVDESNRSSFETGSLSIDSSASASSRDLGSGVWKQGFIPSAGVSWELIYVPEPAETAMFVGMGMLAFGAYRRFRKI